MRLKRVALVNFKSYKGGTTVHLEDGKTLLVGRNGSGKSNFFQAVNFVLGTRNSILGQSARMHFFNNGRDDLKLTVEIVLEDEQGQLPGDIRITRRMGVRSDCFFLNGCRITRKELSFLLEICGFSLNTPYYILTHSLMKVLVTPNPVNRLRAFIECIGLCVSRTAAFLDEKFQLMEELQRLIHEFQAMLDRFNTEEVDAAAARLKEYKTLIKERASLKIKLYSQSITKYENLVKKESEAISRKRQRAHLSASELHELKCQITTAKVTFEKSKNDLATSQLLLSDLETERETLLRNKTRLSLKIGDLEEQVSIEEVNISRDDTDISRSDSTSSQPKKTELEKRSEELSRGFAREKSEVEALGRQLNEKKQLRHDLLLKRGYREKFSTIEEMKQWISSEIRKVNKKYEGNSAAIKSCASKIDEYKKAIEICEGEIKIFDQESNKLHAVLKEESGIKLKISDFHNELNELHRQENSAVNELDTLMKHLKNRKTELVLKVGNSVFNGFESVRKVIASWDSSESGISAKPDGCFGAILQNFKCDPSLNLAVDAAAGSRLLAQIVSSDTLGTAIMKKINSLNLPGDVCFFPLNRIIPPQIISSSRDDAVPLINNLQFPRSVENVMTYLFGRVMLCRDLEVAAEVARKLGCSCVTMDGDRVNSNGPLSGGFIDPKKSTRALFTDFESIESGHRNQIASLQNIRLQIDEKKSAIDTAMSQIQQLQRKIRTRVSGSDRRILTQRVESLKAEEKHHAEQLKQLDCDNQVLLRTRQALLQSAQDQEKQQSSDGEAHVIKELNKVIFEMTKAMNKRSTSLAALESKLNSVANELACSKEAVALKATDVEKLKIIRQKLADMKTRGQVTRARLAAVEEKISLTSANVSANKLNVGKLGYELDDLKKKLRQADEQDGGLNVSVVQEKITNLEQKIEEIKLFREQEMTCHNIKTIEEPTQLSVQEIREQLKRLNEVIDGMESAPLMSATAIKRHKKFLLMKEKSAIGVDEYSSLYVSLWELLPWVQQHIQSCLVTISELYSHYFSLMVEDGNASMILESSNGEAEKAVTFTGLSLSNQFSGGLNLSQMQLLSEGQRVVVLLSIVFAFMKRQRIGFCIMDEIDQSLSASHIDGMLQAMSEFAPHQFLISSHNKTMISIGDHFYVLEFKKSSSITPASRSEIMQLVEDFSRQSKKPSTSLLTSTCSQQSDSSEISTFSVSTSN